MKVKESLLGIRTESLAHLLSAEMQMRDAEEHPSKTAVK